MIEKNEEKIVRNTRGKTVATMQIKNGILDGKCQWFDGEGNLITYGFFKDGEPWAGTFLNWAFFMPEVEGTKPYDIRSYCKDWISIFEASFDSQPPQFENLIEVYSSGKRTGGGGGPPQHT